MNTDPPPVDTSSTTDSPPRIVFAQEYVDESPATALLEGDHLEEQPEEHPEGHLEGHVDSQAEGQAEGHIKGQPEGQPDDQDPEDSFTLHLEESDDDDETNTTKPLADEAPKGATKRSSVLGEGELVLDPITGVLVAPSTGGIEAGSDETGSLPQISSAAMKSNTINSGDSVKAVSVVTGNVAFKKPEADDKAINRKSDQETAKIEKKKPKIEQPTKVTEPKSEVDEDDAKIVVTTETKTDAGDSSDSEAYVSASEDTSPNVVGSKQEIADVFRDSTTKVTEKAKVTNADVPDDVSVSSTEVMDDNRAPRPVGDITSAVNEEVTEENTTTIAPVTTTTVQAATATTAGNLNIWDKHRRKKKLHKKLSSGKEGDVSATDPVHKAKSRPRSKKRSEIELLFDVDGPPSARRKRKFSQLPAGERKTILGQR